MLQGLMAPPESGSDAPSKSASETGPQSGPAPETKSALPPAGAGAQGRGAQGSGKGSEDPAAEKLTAVNSPSAPPARPRSGPRSGTRSGPRSGAVGAISSAVSALRANGVLELDPMTIHAGGLEDRLEEDPRDAETLRRSILAHGQQVPVLVRPHPSIEGEWQIVYGRRRTLAARDLGIRVKALVRDLDDHALVIAQGQENSARRDLSFIEKTHFAERMREAGFERAAICEALSVDKSLASRMLSLADRLPRELIEAIGSAHGVGRPRWQAFADLLDMARAQGAISAETLAREIPLAADTGPGAAPESRFETALALLGQALKSGRAPRPSRPQPVEIRAHDGSRLATARRSSRGATLSLAPSEGFEDWLLSRLPELHAAWREETEAETPTDETAPPKR